MDGPSGILYSMINQIALRAFSVILLPFFLMLSGCATHNEELGAEIREGLGVTRDTLEKTEKSAEKNYDPTVILKRAEAYYQNKDYIEAAGEYQHFLDLHPLHKWADYAMYKLGMSHFHQIRTIDRDPEPVRKALETFQKLLSVFPEVEYVEEAKLKIKACQQLLAEHQLYVGRFYYKKGSYPAAIERFNYLLQTYPDLPTSEDGLYYLGMSYYYSGDISQATVHFRDLLSRYPGTDHQESVSRLLEKDDRTALP